MVVKMVVYLEIFAALLEEVLPEHHRDQDNNTHTCQKRRACGSYHVGAQVSSHHNASLDSPMRCRFAGRTRHKTPRKRRSSTRQNTNMFTNIVKVFMNFIKWGISCAAKWMVLPGWKGDAHEWLHSSLGTCPKHVRNNSARTPLGSIRCSDSVYECLYDLLEEI